MAHKRLSVIIITRNEAANLERCLSSVAFADEIIVVDDHSDDDTVAIARQFTDRVFVRKLTGFGDQKQFALEQATGDWVLALDADEWLSDRLGLRIRAFLDDAQADRAADGYHMYRLNYYLGRPMYRCGWYVPLLRLFRREAGRFDTKRVHESIRVDGALALLPGDILHVPYRDLLHHLQKIGVYARLDAFEVQQRGDRIRGVRAAAALVGRPIWKFCEKYFRQQGFREGVHGLVLSGMAAWGVFLVYAQCWYLQRQMPDSVDQRKVP